MVLLGKDGYLISDSLKKKINYRVIQAFTASWTKITVPNAVKFFSTHIVIFYVSVFKRISWYRVTCDGLVLQAYLLPITFFSICTHCP